MAYPYPEQNQYSIRANGKTVTVGEWGSNRKEGCPEFLVKKPDKKVVPPLPIAKRALPTGKRKKP